MPVSCRRASGKRKSARSRDPAHRLSGVSPKGVWPSRISLSPPPLFPPSLPLSCSPAAPSPPALFAGLLEESRAHHSWKQLPAPRAPRPCPDSGEPLPLRASRIPELGHRALGNRSRRDAFCRPNPAPAGTDLLISRTAGRRELKLLPSSPSLSLWRLVFPFLKEHFIHFLVFFTGGTATRLGEETAL